MNGASSQDPQQHFMFIVEHDGKYYGPFTRDETGHFASKCAGDSRVIPLNVPALPEEVKGPLKLQLMKTDEYRAFVDGFKVDTKPVLTDIIQSFSFARREDRVLTAGEIGHIWKQLFRISHAVESLMHYADKMVADQSPENSVALRKAFWRNRDSDDVDPHYEDRFW